MTPTFSIRAHLVFLTAVAAFCVSGCSSHHTVKSSPAAKTQSTSAIKLIPAPVQRQQWADNPSVNPGAANSVLMRAIGLVGTPYRYGGNTPESGFDCSGLVNYVYRDMLQLQLPRSSRELANWQGDTLGADQLASGDLVFFSTNNVVTHVGIYVGEGRFVHAPTTGGTVRLDYLDGHYWRDHYSGAKRIIRE